MTQLYDFLHDWEKDGFEFKQLDRPKTTDEAKWYLYGVTLPYSSYDHGRHTALMVAVEPKTLEVLAHNFKNIHANGNGFNRGEWRKQILEWWDEHVAEGLVYKD